MGTAGEGKSYAVKEEEYLTKLEHEAVRAALPRGLIDEKGNKLKYELHYCLTRNDWWFTIGQHVCAEQLEVYKEHKARLIEEYRSQAEQVKQRVRQQHAEATGRR